MLPEMNGFEIVENMQCKNTPVIFLSAMGDVADKVKGLRMGAEDYIVKPFETVELLARVEVILRRFRKNVKVLQYDDICIFVDEHIAKKGEETINLTPKEFAVLSFFIQNIDIAISRERLISAVWGYDYMGESRTVDIHIQQVRKKMNLSQRLVTVPKLGYRLES